MSTNLDLTKLADDLQAASDGRAIVEPVLDQVANEIFLDQQTNVPVDTGLLKSTLHIESSPGYRFIGPDHQLAFYDIFVHDGTKPHVIRPKAGEFLSFEVGGKKVVAREVRHPGTKPQPWADNSARRWRETLGPKMADVAVKRIVDGS